MSNNYLPNRVRVQVNGAVYDIPTFKLAELQAMLASWQAIQVQTPQTENQKFNNGNNGQNWQGTQLING